MRKIWLILGIIALALIGCSPAGGNEPAAAESANNAAITKSEAAGTPAPVLVTVVATEEKLPNIETNDSEDVVITTVAPAGSVDLSQITSEPPAEEGGDLIVQPMPGVPDAMTGLVNQASQDLARRIGVDVSEVSLVRTVAVDWRDGSLGCPQPGMAYITVITPGYQIVLEAQDREYYYHSRGTDYFVYCENGRPVEENGSPAPGADQ